MNRKLVTIAMRDAAPVVIGLVVFKIGVFTDLDVLGTALAFVALALFWLVDRPPRLGAGVPARLLLAAAAVGAAAREDDGASWLLVLASVLLFVPLLIESPLDRLAGPWTVVRRLPSPWHGTMPLVRNGVLWSMSSLSIVLFGAFAELGWPTWTLLALTAAVATVYGVVILDGLRTWRSRHWTELANLRRAVERHGPRFLLYFSAPPGSDYQVRMWLPYLERIGEPFLVVLAEERNLASVASMTSAPVVLCRTFEALDAVMVDGLRAVFYVNNGMRNAHCVRYPHLTHVQLYHGDSDKAVSASPVVAMFDKIFVAGQAAIDRYAAHGVQIPVEKFQVVGRPQVADIEPARGPIAELTDRVVLYAPTWRGGFADVQHCSLPIAEPIVRGLLDRGLTVIVRPHPYVRQDRTSVAQLERVEQMLARDKARTGRPHLWGQAAETELSLHGCMNLSDAVICDVSTVATEYLYSDKPFAVTDMTTADSRLIRATALAGAAYVLSADAGNLAQVLDELLERDPLAAARHRMRTYYLGDFPIEGYEEVFLTAARRCLLNPDAAVDDVDPVEDVVAVAALEGTDAPAVAAFGGPQAPRR